MGLNVLGIAIRPGSEKSEGRKLRLMPLLFAKGSFPFQDYSVNEALDKYEIKMEKMKRQAHL